MPIPETRSNCSSTKDLYAESGVIIFRQAIPGTVLDQLNLLCSALFSVMDLKVKERELGEARADDPLSEYVKLYSKLQFVGDDVARAVFSNSHLGSAGYDKIAGTVSRVVSEALGKNLTHVPAKSAFRRQGTEGNAQRTAYVPWHRDAHAVRTADFGECLNCWVPLHSVGVTRPSLQVVVGSSNRLRHQQVNYDHDDPHPDDDGLRELYGKDSICTAVLEPGDFMIFDHHTLHRTQPMGQSYPIRVSGEMRFINAR